MKFNTETTSYIWCGLNQLKNNKMKNFNKNQYCIIRTDRAGVFAGYVAERNGSEAVLTNARRLYYWNGAATLSQMAIEGVKYPDDCKFTVEVPHMIVLGIIEIIPCSQNAENIIKNVEIWKM